MLIRYVRYTYTVHACIVLLKTRLPLIPILRNTDITVPTEEAINEHIQEVFHAKFMHSIISLHIYINYT